MYLHCSEKSKKDALKGKGSFKFKKEKAFQAFFEIRKDFANEPNNFPIFH